MTAATKDKAEVAIIPEDAAKEAKRKTAILRAVGLENVPPEQRELALAIATRYDLDLMLKHLVLVEGRPYITRDALLWVAHRSGQFDGIQVTTPAEIREMPEVGKCWYAEVTVYRKDMTHSFTYPGRYPVAGSNKRYGPEMAIKVAECMALRRAFNVSAATVEERWEQAGVSVEQVPIKSLAEVAAEKANQITAGAPAMVAPTSIDQGRPPTEAAAGTSPQAETEPADDLAEEFGLDLGGEA